MGASASQTSKTISPLTIGALRSRDSLDIRQSLDSITVISLETEDNGWLDQLPNEICFLIFSYLTKRELIKISIVCKTFYAIVARSESWKSLDIWKDYPVVIRKHLKDIDSWVTAQNKKLIKLKQNKQKPSIFSLIGESRCNLVESLCLVDAGSDNLYTRTTYIQDLSTFFPNLVHLDLSGLMIGTPQLVDLFKKANFTQTLKSLILNDCPLVDNEVLALICEKCTNLESLDIRHSRISSKDCALLLPKLGDKLKSLSVEGIDELDDEFLRMIGKNFKLTTFKFIGCLSTSITYNGIQYLLQSIGIHLTRLDLRGGLVIDDNSLKLISTHCPDIIDLGLGSCIALTEVGLKEVISHSTKLESLNLFGLKAPTDEICQLISIKCVNLKKLNICGCKKISDTGISYLSALPNLKVLDIALCTTVTGEGFRSLANSGASETLESLALDYLHKVTEVGIPLLGNFKKLTSIRLSGLKLTDEWMALLGTVLPLKVETIYFTDCEAITDKGVDLFLQQSTKIGKRDIKYLNINYCEDISINGILNLLTNLPRITTLDLKHNRKLIQSIDTILQAFPHIKIISN